MIRQGVVSFVPDAMNSAGRVQVQLSPLSGCGNCASASGCGLQLLPAKNDLLALECLVTCDSHILVGDRVDVRLDEPDSGWLRVVTMAYGMPTIGMIIGAAVGYWAATGLQLTQARELISLLGFFLGLTGGLIAWGRVEKSTRCGLVQQGHIDTATIVGVVPNSGETI